MEDTPNSGVPSWLNTAMKFILRSPLHRLVSQKIMLITFTGCKSGKTYTTPVSYLQQDDSVVLFTHAQWWRNFEAGTPVGLHLKGKPREASVEEIAQDAPTIAEGLTAHLRNNHFDAKYYGVSYDPQGNPIPEDVKRATDGVVMVRAKLKTAA